mmetsp:Transcript_3676/g.7894  ORF Transcript_3676/g.7894 Transcript_3676/m.7894 type:complete len:465 (-) Transcript_3676:799-2193(-)
MVYREADSDVRLIRPRPQRVLPPQSDSCLNKQRRNDINNNRIAKQSAAEEGPHLIPPTDNYPLIARHSNLPKLNIPVPKLVRPIALKVSCPIPKTAIEQFYNETYKQGIEAQHAHEAAILAQDWHRKWTLQDEQGHTMPEPELDSQSKSPLDSVCDFNPLTRLSGAKNPSPEDVEHARFFERKRHRLNANGSLESVSPDSYSNNIPQRTRRRVIEYEESREVLAPGLVKPTPLRLQKPQPVRAADLMAQEQHPEYRLVPEDIVREQRSQTLSPLTLPSMSSRSRAQKPAVVENEPSENSLSEVEGIPSMVSHPSKNQALHSRSPEVQDAREGVLHRLAVTGGDVASDPEFCKHLDLLKQTYESTKSDTRFTMDENATSEGMWLTLTKPTYFGNLGTNDDGDPMYTLGRMSFDMFSPTRLVCSLQGNFNQVEKISDKDRTAMLDKVPKALREEVESGNTILRSYK